MRRFIVLILLLISLNSVYSENQKSIVLMDFQNLAPYDGYGFLRKYLRNVYSSVLQTKYKLIQRTEFKDFISEVMSVSPDLLFNRKIGFQLGRLLNANAVILGRFSYIKDKTLSLEIMLVLVNKGKVYSFRNTTACKSEELLKTVHKMCMKIYAQILYRMR